MVIPSALRPLKVCQPPSCPDVSQKAHGTHKAKEENQWVVIPELELYLFRLIDNHQSHHKTPRPPVAPDQPIRCWRAQ